MNEAILITWCEEVPFSETPLSEVAVDGRSVHVPARELREPPEGIGPPSPLFPNLQRLRETNREDSESQERRLLEELDRYRCLRVSGQDELASVMAWLSRRQARGLARDVETLIDPGSDTPEACGAAKVDALEQGYLDDEDKGGIALGAVGSVAGADGSNSGLVLVEKGWCPHPDLPSKIEDLSNQELRKKVPGADHGNSMLGILVALDDKVGVRGIVPEARSVRVARFDVPHATAKLEETNVNAVTLEAMYSASPGDVLVVAVYAKKTYSGVGGYVQVSPRLPMEAWKSMRILFHLAAERGVYTVAAAGNGYCTTVEDFCTGPYFRSPALLIGAGRPDGGKPVSSSNQGCRVDLHSWGEDVATCLETGHTRYFNGTSSACAIVAGVVSCVVSMVYAETKRYPEAEGLRRMLQRTGYNWIPGIGTRPHLGRILKFLQDHKYELP